MKKNDRKRDISAVIIKGISVFIVFAAATALVIAALFAFMTRGEFVSTWEQRASLSASLVLTTLGVLFVFSMLFTPFSYGISYYFIGASDGNADIYRMFYLFKQPRLLIKAVTANFVRLLIVNVLRVLTLALAMVCECGLFVISIALSGENVFDYEDNFLESVAGFVTHDPFFITLTVIEWCAVIAVFVYIYMRYLLCKYALMLEPKLTVWETIRIGEFSIRGRIIKTVAFYVKYLSVYVFTYLTLGLSGYGPTDSFSSYAIRVTRDGMEEYYRKKR